jgi:hypothetical protein
VDAIFINSATAIDENAPRFGVGFRRVRNSLPVFFLHMAHPLTIRRSLQSPPAHPSSAPPARNLSRASGSGCHDGQPR